MSSFENLRIVDNFYQTSLFFPMPTVIISTLCEDGTTSLGPYSLVQPYYVAGKDYYAMLAATHLTQHRTFFATVSALSILSTINQRASKRLSSFHGPVISPVKKCLNVISNLKRV